MKNSRNLAERRYCTSANLASRENLQARIKVQGHSSIARAKKAIQALTHPTNKFTVSTRMGADHQKIRRKISDLHDQKVRIGHTILEKIASKLEVVTQVKAEAGGDFRIGVFITCSTRETPIIRQEIVPFSLSLKRR
jgi:hypothetical protein